SVKAQGAEKAHLERVAGALRNRIMDVVGEKYSAEKPKAEAKEWTDAEKTKARDEFHRIAGDDLKVAFEKAFDWSGKWNEKDTATFSTFASDPSSTVWHEALHALFTRLRDPNSRTKLWDSLDRVANNGMIMRQLEKLLKD